MAIVRITSITTKVSKAKKTIRYIAHRPERDRERVTRDLFGRDGVATRDQAYRAIDEAKKGSSFFRIVISPDPKLEDTLRDLNMRNITEMTMLTLQERFADQDVEYFASVHTDHSDNRHVHVLVILNSRIAREDLKALRLQATGNAKAQRKTLDQVHAASRERSRTRPQAHERAHRAKAFRVPHINNDPACPTCGPGQLMDRYGRDFKCSNCGIKIKRARRSISYEY